MKKHSQETKDKISKSHLKRKKKLGYINSPKARKKMSETLKKKLVDGKSKFPLSFIHFFVLELFCSNFPQSPHQARTSSDGDIK